MKKLLLLVMIIFGCMQLSAQEYVRPHRTPEEEAEKFTEMLQRELELDSAQRDTIYKINLKYARLRRMSNTRAENLDRMNRLTTELQGVLTAKQFNAFMNRQVEVAPHRPSQPVSPVRMPFPKDSSKTVVSGKHPHTQPLPFIKE